MSWRIIALLALVSWPYAAEAAKITVMPGAEAKNSVVLIEGIFEDGDQAEFQTKVSPYSHGVVVLDSTGGNVWASIVIGRIIRLRGFMTWVPSGATCASACALAWLGGK